MCPARSKAVAEGGVSFYLENFVSVRAMLLTYGTNITIPYCASDPDHYARRAEIFARPSGRIVLPKAFSIIIQKVRDSYNSLTVVSSA